MKLAIFGIIILSVLLQYRLWFSNGGVLDVYRLKQAIEEQSAENRQLQTRNAALEAEVLDLKQGLDAIEERARRELGMIKRGETFFQLVK
jgi:cell division protein FtsB